MSKDMIPPTSNFFFLLNQVDQRNVTLEKKVDSLPDEELERRYVKQYNIVDQQQRDIKVSIEDRQA